jgi:hypothetical protein
MPQAQKERSCRSILLLSIRIRRNQAALPQCFLLRYAVVSFAFFIPVYFTIVRLKLDLVKAFSWQLLLLFLAASSKSYLFHSRGASLVSKVGPDQFGPHAKCPRRTRHRFGKRRL